MSNRPGTRSTALLGVMAVALSASGPAWAQLIDRTKAPNAAHDGIAKSLDEQIGAGRGTDSTPGSSLYLIARDPFRAIRRGRQLFQRKFTRDEGQGPGVGNGRGDINTVLAIGAGLSDSCAGCHGRPRGGAGFGGVVVTRPDSRDAPHLYGLGLKEMLADEITADLRAIRADAIRTARQLRRPMTVPLTSKGIDYGSITARPDGSVDTSRVTGVDPDLRVRPFFAHGDTLSIREFVVGALNNEMGLQVSDPDLSAAVRGARVTTPGGMVLDGSLDRLESPPIAHPTPGEVNSSLIDFLEFYLLNYFKPAVHEQTARAQRGRKTFEKIGCARCHVPDLPLARDRRVADVETTFDAAWGIFNGLFAVATPLHDRIDDHAGLPARKPPLGRPFVVRNIFTDFKRHDLGPYFHERNYDGTARTEFMTTPLWGVGSTPPYGHDGRSINLKEVILRHGGAAAQSAGFFERLTESGQGEVMEFLNSLVLFPPDDTASNLDPGDPGAPGFPQAGHGSIKLGVLFENPADPE
jgi:mono/diheme cytochrome c family protein